MSISREDILEDCVSEATLTWTTHEDGSLTATPNGFYFRISHPVHSPTCWELEFQLPGGSVNRMGSYSKLSQLKKLALKMYQQTVFDMALETSW